MQNQVLHLIIWVSQALKIKILVLGEWLSTRQAAEYETQYFTSKSDLFS